MIRNSASATAGEEQQANAPQGESERLSSEDGTATNEVRDRARRLRRRLLIGLGGLVLGLGLFVTAWILHASSNRIPELTRADFDAAWSRWQQRQPADYSITTTVVGLQPATYQVQVVAGVVEAAKRNGSALKDQRTLGTWSVPGMFRTIEHDLLAWEAFHESHGASSSTDGGSGDGGTTEHGSQLHLRAEFDPEYGFPQRYLRLEWGTSAQVSWNVDQFQLGLEETEADDPLSGDFDVSVESSEAVSE